MEKEKKKKERWKEEINVSLSGIPNRQNPNLKSLKKNHIMKKNILLSIFFTLFISFGLLSNITKANSDYSSVSFPIGDDGCTGSEWLDEDLSGYKFYEGYLFNNFCVVEGVDINSYKIINIDGTEYVIDDKSMFSGVKKLEGIDPHNYKKKIVRYTNNDGEYRKIFIYDDDTVYMDDIEANAVDVDSVKILNFYWLKDKNHVYQIKRGNRDLRVEYLYHLEILPDADPNHFYFGYAVEDGSVYWYGKKIEEADASTAKVAECDPKFLIDKNNVYWKGKVLYGANIKTFGQAIIDELYYCVDKNGMYFEQSYGLNKTIKEIKKEIPESIESLNQSLKSSLLEYREKYPHYIPKPAQDPENPERFYNLRRFFDYYVLDYKYLNPPLYYMMIVSPFILPMIIIGVFVWKRRKRKKKGGKKK